MRVIDWTVVVFSGLAFLVRIVWTLTFMDVQGGCNQQYHAQSERSCLLVFDFLMSFFPLRSLSNESSLVICSYIIYPHQSPLRPPKKKQRIKGSK
jgi:hypothetical protein